MACNGNAKRRFPSFWNFPQEEELRERQSKEVIMARSPKLGDTIPLSVVRKENAVPQPDPNQNPAASAAETVENAAGKAIQDIAEQLRALKEQVQALQATTGQVASQAGKVVASSARAAGDKVSESARIAGDKAVSGAKVAGEKVTTTVETYPISALLIASGVAFLLGRMSSSAFSQPSYSESTFDSLRSRLGDLSSQLPSHLKSALRSSLR
jgi:ElaB/YqjD/DUF883 family membrane-anchored ribosome-binding protein